MSEAPTHPGNGSGDTTTSPVADQISQALVALAREHDLSMAELAGLARRLARESSAPRGVEPTDASGRFRALMQASQAVMAAKTRYDLLERVAAAARTLTSAQVGAAIHGNAEDGWQVGGTLPASDLFACLGAALMAPEPDTLLQRLIDHCGILRLTEEECHVECEGSEVMPVRLRGLLAAELVGTGGQPAGLILASNRASGQFTDEDEALLAQLATIASLSLSHIEAAEAARRRAQELDAVFSVPVNPMLVYSADAVVVRADPSAVSAIGMDPVGHDQAWLTRYLDLRYPDGSPVEPDETAAGRALRGETVVAEMFRMHLSQGREILVETSSAPILAEGTVTGAVVTWHDVTERERLLRQVQSERERAEQLAERLRLERDLLETVMGNTEERLAYLTPDFRFVHVNAAYCRGCGLKPEDLIGRSHFELFPHEEIEAIFNRVLATGEAAHYREQVLGRPQDPQEPATYWDWDLVPVKDELGNVLGLVLSLSDVTASVQARLAQERLAKEAEARAEELAQHALELAAQQEELMRLTRELDEERAWLQAIIDGAPIGIVMKDATGAVTMDNPIARALFSPPNPSNGDEGVCGPVAICWPDGTPCSHYDLPVTRSAVAGEVRSEAELLLLWPDGQRRELMAYSAPIRDASGKLMGAVGILQDVSPLRAAERERERLEQLKAEFISNVSHELRTPLTASMGYTELLLSGGVGEVPEAQREFLQTIYESNQHLQWLVDDLLDVSRMESGRFELELGSVGLQEVVEAVAERMRPAAQDSGVELRPECEPDLPTVWGDARRLQQVLGNLLSNAVKYTPRGGLARICARRADEDHVLLEVSDTGMGIDPQDLPDLFQRFHRGRNAVDGNIPGTGLGLYIAKSIVESHGGRIEVESSLGCGTTFRVYLPAEGAA
jgi:two-component system phosphate regulon sensor histidine kinase PhoR